MDGREDDQPMRLAGAHGTVRRIWTVELRPQAGGPGLVCPHCTAHTPSLKGSSARAAALAHLACHARADTLPGHLRTCQCRERGCSWHPRHRGCGGPVLLALTRDRSGRTWRLADTCAACAAATSHTAVVPDTLLGPRRLRPDAYPPAPVRDNPGAGRDERVRVREMLTYLASAVPRFTSPAARLLALQCALRADARGQVRLPAGLLRGMRLQRRQELWQELAQARWLEMPVLKPAPVTVYLLDATVLDQAPGRSARRRAAHWALHCVPLVPPAVAPPVLRLTALVLAAHCSGHGGHGTDMDVLARLCGHSPHQTGELLDRLVALRTLAAWHRDRETDQVVWQLPSPHTRTRPAARGPRHRLAEG
ncbi:hypothetical protein [Streptomyces sp. MB09-02B]|uniref:hypothetical protein n=1 Tax=Streptomyces sp. MB09-02B TaxID=3028667 RepID=UPI0029B5873D|nr:hypothetical protein [Streptomyces sp. MB09-02B]MDX3640171.1 hypothetical protein [Streptomyces sp. MB09-02B]